MTAPDFTARPLVSGAPQWMTATHPRHATSLSTTPTEHLRGQMGSCRAATTRAATATGGRSATNPSPFSPCKAALDNITESDTQ